MKKIKNKKIKILPIFLFFFFFINSANFAQTDLSPQDRFSQSNNLYQWGSISSFHGLPSERVNAIAQTKDGVLWFGTEKGLAKFDGRRVQTITSQNLSILKILVLKSSSDGKLWIGTESGAFYFENETFSPVEETQKSSINSIFISDIDQSIYLSSDKGLVFEIQPTDENKFKTVKILDEDLEIKSISQIGDKLVIGTHKRGILIVENKKPKDIPSRPRQYFVNAFAKDAKNKLWVGTQIFNENSGLYFAKTLTDWEKIDAAVGTVTSLSFDGYDNLWVGTKNRGAFKFRESKQIERFTFENTAGGLRSNEILTTFIDRENVIWFGTDKGVCRFDQSSPNNENISDDVQSNYVRTLYETKSGTVFAGTNRDLYFKNEDNKWQSVNGFDQKAVYAISENSQNNLMVGTSNGFYYDVNLKKDSQKEFSFSEDDGKSFNESVRSIQNFQGRTYLAFFGRGLAKFENENVVFNLPNNQIQQITSLHNDNDKILWIGTANNGVFTFDGNQIGQFPQLESLKNIAVWSVDGNLQDGVWFGTEQGLFLFQNGELKKVLPDTDVRSVKILSTENNSQKSVWCATVNGLIQIIQSENFGWIFSRIDVEQGLPSQSTFTILRQNGESEFETLYIGTNRGIVKYYVNRIKPLLITTRILSKRLHAAIELKDGIDLEYPQNSFAVEVAGLSSRTFPEQFQYSFILRDAKGEIISKKLSNDSQFLMENLEAGNYTVEILAYDKNLTASEPLIFNFSIAKTPFPWTTLALTVLLSFAVIALIWAIFSQRRISRTSSELAVANKELNSARLDLANEAERERRRISRDLHDQTLADLRHLLLLTDKLPIEEKSAENAAHFRTEIENVSNEIRNICEDLSPSVLENIGFTAALEWALSNAVQDSKQIITSEFVCDEKTEEKISFSPTVQIQIYRIAQEVLSNIVQHSNATHIKMSFEKNQERVFNLKIEDNGQGFDISKIQTVKSRGLTNIKARADLIEAEVSWRNTSDGGTVFLLSKS
jgi:signal transduction histidine kinase/ligand-binding sensor domain-containing protein